MPIHIPELAPKGAHICNMPSVVLQMKDYSRQSIGSSYSTLPRPLGSSNPVVLTRKPTT
uniref:Uncharacterized protein n=1 Tax=Anguilla anguilla TaxID=7936 RepID=A0A0E9PCZ2_ANGAN